MTTTDKIGADKIADEILRERKRQVVVENFSRAADDLYIKGELPQAAICYLMNSIVWAQMLAAGLSRAQLDAKSASAEAPQMWPWSRRWWKPRGPRENLVRAGALIIAEIERLDRAAPVLIDEFDGSGDGKSLVEKARK